MKRKLLLVYFLLILYAVGYSQTPAYIIDFENDTPTISFITDQLVEVSGEVLLNNATRQKESRG